MQPANPLREINQNEHDLKDLEDKRDRLSPFVQIMHSRYDQVIVPMPQQHEELLARLRRCRVGVFQESNTLDTYQVLRQTAFELAEDGLYKVKELAGTTSAQQLIPSMERESGGTIFLLGLQTPVDLNHDLTKLSKLAVQKDFWILARTNLSAEVWSPMDFVFSLEPATFIAEQLVAYLQNLLSKQTFDLNGDKSSKAVMEKLSDEIYLLGLCQALKRPVQIELFVQHLINQGGPLSLQALESARKAALENKYSPVVRSFKMQNDHRRLIALGLVLFDGLYDDQFFSAMSYLAQRSWSGRAEQLRALDYCDLEAVSSFFNYNNIVGDERFIQHKSSDQRQAIIDYAWYSYRRHLLSALPILAELVIQSATDIQKNWELFGTRDKRDRLRASITDTISDLGLKAPESVEHTLIQLAANRTYVVQAVAANVLAKWYSKGQYDLFFGIIDKWQKDQKFVNLVVSILRERNPDQPRLRYRAMDHIKATLLLTLGEAATLDEAGGSLNPKIIEAMRHALKENSELLKKRYSQILPKVIALHLEEFWKNKLLSQLINKDYLVYSVALGIARAYERSPALVERLFNMWLPIVNDRRHWSVNVIQSINKQFFTRIWNYFSRITLETDEVKTTEDDKLNLRDRVAIALILTCKHLVAHNDTESPVEICGLTPLQILFDFRLRERNQIVKTICYKVLVSLLETADDDIAQQLTHLDDTIHDQSHIAHHLAERYLVERQQLTGGEEEMKIDKRTYSIWITKENRPDVPVEKIMKKWLVSGTNDQKRVSFLALDEFVRRLEANEDRLIKKIIEEQEALEAEDSSLLTQPASLLQMLKVKVYNLLYTLRKYWITTFKSRETTQTLHAIAPVLRSRYFAPDRLALIVEKLKDDDQIPNELPDGIEQLYKITD